MVGCFSCRLTYKVITQKSVDKLTFIKLQKEGVEHWYKLTEKNGKYVVEEMLSVVTRADGTKWYNGEPKENHNFFRLDTKQDSCCGQELDKSMGVLSIS
jgi:hypothetical protein